MPRPQPGPDPSQVVAEVRRSLLEDLGSGDASAALLPAGRRRAQVVVKEAAVLAGRDWFDACFRELDPSCRIDWRFDDGDRLAAGDVVCRLDGDARALVSAERSALNFLQTLSGTATATRRFVDAVAGLPVRLLDTRKTLPGLRLAQKYAVRCGGGHNHRIGLFDAVMLKENHILAAGSIGAAVAAARERFPGLPTIVEVENLDELRQALEARPERILLDEFSLDGMREAVALSAGRVPLEASGGMELDALRAVAATGVDCISIGALTKHLRAIDFSLRLLAD